jgi:hypothetical protein
MRFKVSTERTLQNFKYSMSFILLFTEVSRNYIPFRNAALLFSWFNSKTNEFYFLIALHQPSFQ